VDKLIAAVEQESGTILHVIGEMLPVEEGRRLVLPDGQDLPLSVEAWQHFQAEE
jgi:hypothetical protein